MSEEEFTNSLVSNLSSLLKSCKIGTKIPLLYAITVDENGNIEPGLSEEGLPMRGRGTGFEQDILLYEEVNGQTKIVPRVAIEVKFQRITTHSVLVYSDKAHRIRSIYPYLRYGLILGERSHIPPRALRLGMEFDFILSTDSTLTSDELLDLALLLNTECDISRKLSQSFTGKVKVKKLTKYLEIHTRGSLLDPQAESHIAPNPPKNYKIITKSTADRQQSTYYVYENWQAENKARIHRGECVFCKFGKGIHTKAGTRNGRWHGPFGTIQEANKCAKETGRIVSYCKSCSPL